MEPLLTWRNPLGNERNWVVGNHANPRQSGAEWLGKRVGTALGLGLLTIVATIETLAYISLAFISVISLPFSDEPFRFSIKLLQSSSFTIAWTFSNLTVFNNFSENLMTHESFARWYAKSMRAEDHIYIDPLLARLRAQNRRQDQALLAQILANHFEFQPQPLNINNPAARLREDELRHVLRAIVRQMQGEEARNPSDAEVQAFLAEAYDPQNGARPQVDSRPIQLGINFIKTEIFSGISEKTKELLRESDPSAFYFVLAKAVFIYAFGSKKHAEIPSVFHEETIKEIERLRKILLRNDALGALEKKCSDSIEYQKEGDIEAEETLAIFRRLNTAAARSDRSRFLTECLQEAVKSLGS